MAANAVRESLVGVPGSSSSYSETLSKDREAPKPADASPGMNLGALLGRGLVLLFVGLVLYGLSSADEWPQAPQAFAYL